MCTVSLVPSDGALSLMCNRDERHLRVPALPPIAVRFGGREAMLPIDPEGRGTWIAVNDAGLALVVLNRRDSGPSANVSSRGLIIPQLLASASLAEAAGAALKVDATRFRPFTLLIVNRQELATITGDSRSLTAHRRPLILPLMVTSSSVDEERARALRARLFRRMVISEREPLPGQAAFHAHQWPDHRGLSVRMWRPDARTVSRTHVRIDASGVSLEYAELPLQ